MSFVTADQLVAHLVGDYILQSHWMATEKTKHAVAALAHAICYTLPFLLLTQSPAALAVIAGSHFVIDRWRLARYVVWLKNWLGLPTYKLGPRNCHASINCVVDELPNKPWSECSNTGYPDETPPWLSVWLLIVADNTIHVLCNAAALRFLGAA